MSDAGGDDAAPPTTGAAAGGPMDVQEALKEVLKLALISDGLYRGLHESAKALDKREVHFCVLAENCDEPMYVKLVEALCGEHGIDLIKVKDKKTLGEWVGLCKMDKEGNPRKVVPLLLLRRQGLRHLHHPRARRPPVLLRLPAQGLIPSSLLSVPCCSPHQPHSNINSSVTVSQLLFSQIIVSARNC